MEGMKKKTMNKEEKRKRIVENGEVFTPLSVVNKMLDLLPLKMFEYDKTFFEPTCGEGIFLVEILKRKLKEINKNKQLSFLENRYFKIISLQSLYGVDIMEDNVLKTRELLKKTFFKNGISKKELGNIGVELINIILERNIIVGDTLKEIDKDGADLSFYDWNEKKYIKLKDMKKDQQKTLF